MTDYRLEGEPQPRCARIVARASCPCGGVKRRRSSRRLTLPVLRKSGKLSSHSSVDVSAVHFTAVSDADDDNDKLTVTNRVNNSPVTYADAVEAFHADQLNSIRWSRIVLKRLEFEDNAMPHVAGHVVEYLARPFI